MEGYQETLQPSIKSMRNKDKMIIVTTQTGLPTERVRDRERGREGQIEIAHSLLHYKCWRPCSAESSCTPTTASFLSVCVCVSVSERAPPLPCRAEHQLHQVRHSLRQQGWIPGLCAFKIKAEKIPIVSTKEELIQERKNTHLNIHSN